MAEVSLVRLEAPVAVGDVIIENIAGTGAKLVSAKTMTVQPS